MDRQTDGRTDGQTEKEKTPHMCESIGHLPLRDRCPKKGPTNQPTDRWTDKARCTVAEHATYKGET